MQRKKIYFIILVIKIFTISCNNSSGEGYVPDWGPKNIKFSPSSGKVGDIITITGDDFYPVEEMELYVNDRVEFNHKYGTTRPLIYFNVNIYYTKETDYLQLHIEGTDAVEYIEFDKNKIVCKVPVGAKSGKIWVNGCYTASGMELHHPSEEEFIVYDESGDEVR